MDTQCPPAQCHTAQAATTAGGLKQAEANADSSIGIDDGAETPNRATYSFIQRGLLCHNPEDGLLERTGGALGVCATLRFDIGTPQCVPDPLHSAGTRTVRLLDLPHDVKQTILCAVADTDHTALFAIASTCKGLSQDLKDSGLWERAWAKWLTGEHGLNRQLKKVEDRPTDLSAREGLRLLATRGCMVCGNSNTCKVLWAFMLRCCEDCRAKHEVSGWELKVELGINTGLLAYLRQAEAHMYPDGARPSYQAVSFWDQDVDRALRLQGWQPPLAEMRAELSARKAEKEKLAKDRRLLAECKRRYGASRERRMRDYLIDNAVDLWTDIRAVERVSSWRSQAHNACPLSLTPKFLQQLRSEVQAFWADPAAVAKAKKDDLRMVCRGEAVEECWNQGGFAVDRRKRRSLKCTRCAPSCQLYSLSGLSAHIRSQHSSNIPPQDTQMLQFWDR